MKPVTFTVNGKAVNATVEPRLHLADFLREHIHLTGTHIGCEHGVCGACTLLVDEAPARSCITFAAACDGRAVRSIEGLEDDAVMTALRAAFKAEHALQCGYCTPGMLVTARDIVLRLPDADDEHVRLELAGNLCRCTGYAGIVRAIRRVLNAPPAVVRPSAAKLPMLTVPDFPAPATGAVAVPDTKSDRTAAPGDGNTLLQRLRLALPRDELWAALQDPALIAGAVPGARLTSIEGGKIAGEMLIALGPIQGKFAGTATIDYEPPSFAGTVRGEGRDQMSGTRLAAQARFAVEADGEEASILILSITYALRGPLAQFARRAVVQSFADEIARLVARNLEARLRGDPVQTSVQRLGAFGLLVRVVIAWLKSLFASRG